MQIYVKVQEGQTRQGTDVSGRTFALLQQAKKDQEGYFIVVDGTPYDDLRNGRCRIYIKDIQSYEPTTENSMPKAVLNAAVAAKSDTEILNEIKETFDILRDMTGAIASGIVKGLVVSGPAGVGKSHTVETTLQENLDVLGKMRGVKNMYEVVHGAMSASVLYEKLWTFKDVCNVLVFDDCDGILYDEDALNILKAALDSKPVRKIHWNTNSHILERKDIPNSFEYQGSIVFITNIDFTQVRSPRISNHLSAIVSRCHYMNLGINTVREKILHIKNIVDSTNMLNSHEFTASEKQEVMDYVLTNAEKLREISLRSCLKVADLRKAMPDRWQRFADKNVLKAA
jgi:Asp-tRNA(Asn)/Glu-tRNA(Gln) amidotransferase C subunit